MALPALAELVANSGESAPSFFNKDSKPGDTVTGHITDVQVRQARDPQTNKLRTWENGDPTLQVVVTIQTDLDPVDENDDGARSIFIKWWGVQRKALLAALKAAGQEDLSDGQEFTATFVSTEKATGRAMSDTKIYEYTIA
jgi:hypothetical protein